MFKYPIPGLFLNLFLKFFIMSKSLSALERCGWGIDRLGSKRLIFVSIVGVSAEKGIGSFSSSDNMLNDCKVWVLLMFRIGSELAKGVLWSLTYW